MHKRHKNHTIDLVFAIALFCVFAVSALAVTVSGADLYRRTTTRSSDEYQSFTGLSYLGEKVRQHDYTGGISLEDLDGITALGLHDRYGDEAYTTYIYVHEGRLKELFVKSGSQTSPRDGTDLTAATSVSFSVQAEDLLSIRLCGPSGDTESLLVHLQSQGGIIE